MSEETMSLELMLDQAARINEEHHAGDKAALTALTHYHRAGILLNEVKTTLPHGEWLPWLEANFDGTPRTAQRYVKLANNWEVIANTTDMSHLTLTQALGQLEQPKNAVKPYEPTYAQYTRYKMMPDITGERWEGFKDSIRRSGVLEAIWVDEDGNILDGHMRVKAVNELRREGHDTTTYGVRVREGLNGEEKIKFVLDCQFLRANYTESQRAVIMVELEKELELEAQEAAERAAQERSQPENFETTL